MMNVPSPSDEARETARNPAGNGGKSRGRSLIVAAIACLVFANTLFFGFVTDDFDNIIDNDQVQRLIELPSYFSSPITHHTSTQYYRPLFTLSLALDQSLWGLRPFGYHLTNVLLHVLCALLVLRGAGLFVSSPIAVLAAGILFAVHPVHSEAIAWISARNEPFCAISVMLALFSYHRFRSGDSVLMLIASILLYGVGLLFKETALVVPLLVGAYEVSFGAKSLRKALWWIFVFSLVTLPYLLVRMTVLDAPFGDAQPLAWRVNTSFVIMREYIRLLIFPVELRVIYRHIGIQTSFLNISVLVSLLVVSAAVAALVLAWRKNRIVFFWLLWIFVTLLPVSGLPAIIRVSPVAERYLYLPSVGLCMLAAIGIDRLAVRYRDHKLAVVAGAAVLAMLFGYTVYRNYVWENPFSNAAAMAADAPAYSQARNALGVEYMAMGKYELGEKEIKTAIALSERPDDAIMSNLGVLYTKLNRHAEAERIFIEGLQQVPASGRLYYNLGLLYYGQGRHAAAWQCFQKARIFSPENADILNNLGVMATAAGRKEEALEYLEEAVRLKPHRSMYRSNLEAARAGSGGGR